MLEISTAYYLHALSVKYQLKTWPCSWKLLVPLAFFWAVSWVWVASISRGVMPFCWKKYLTVHIWKRHFGDNHPYCFLMSGWNGFTRLRAGSFLNCSCICKCFGWRDSNKMQPEVLSGKEMSCTTPACSACSGTPGQICVPSEEMLRSSRWFPG